MVGSCFVTSRFSRRVYHLTTRNFLQQTQKKYRYPCTGRTTIEGFPSFLERELGASRHNITSFQKELTAEFGWPRISLTNSGSSANLAASLTIADRIKEQKGINNTNGPLHLGQVLTAGFTFPSTMSSLLTAAGFSLKVVDTDENSFCLSPEALEASISDETVAVCVTHFLGFPAPMAAIHDIARKNNLLILQDACETMKLNVDGKPAHEFGDISTWSFYHPHHLSSFGGGAVSSPHESWQLIIESMTHWGRKCTCHFNPSICEAPEGMHHNFWYTRIGHNLEMSELNACFGRFQLQHWTEMESARVRYYSILYEALKDLHSIEVYPMAKDCGSPFVFPIRIRYTKNLSVDKCMEELSKKGVEIRSLMGGTITEQPAYRHIPTDSLANCLRISKESFFVGVHQTLQEEDVKEVARILNQEFQ